MEKDTVEYLILKSINNGEKTISQRDIARIANISLGMANSIIKRLVEKGLLKVKYLKSKKMQYLLTASGMFVLTNRRSECLKKTIKNMVLFNQVIDVIVQDIKEKDFNTINLIGESDLLFLIENSCKRNGIELQQKIEEVNNNDIKNVYSESFLPIPDDNKFYLAERLIQVINTL